MITFRRSLACLCLFLACSSLFADGGTLRLVEDRGGLRISVFTSPTPVRIGTLDVSVLVQDASSGKIRLDLPIRVSAWPGDEDEPAREARASADLATNKLLQAAHVDLHRSGPWTLLVQVGSPNPVPVRFDLEVAEGRPFLRGLALWIGWPMGVIALFFLGRLLRRQT